jgi:hypothetical protein
LCLPFSPPCPHKSTGYEAGYFIETKSVATTTLSFDATWNIPTVTCIESGQIFYFSLGVSYEYGATSAGSTLEVTCSGTTSTYSFGYDVGSSGGGLGPDTISPGDKIETIGSVVPSTGTYTVEIKDLTKGWDFGPLTTTRTMVSTQGGAVFLLCGTPAKGGCAGSVTTPLQKFTTIKITNVKLTIAGHTGSIGSFLSISGIQTTKEVWVNLKSNGGTGDTVAKPTSLSSTSTGFSIKWITGL